MRNPTLALVVSTAALALAACDSAQEPFSLRFAAVDRGQVVGCTNQLTGYGPNGDHTIGANDLRFYVSNLRFADAGGAAIGLTLDRNDFQYHADDGDVALVDLTGNTTGSCASSAISFAEGTPRENAVITGKTELGRVAQITFDVGVPQPLMKQVIANTTPEGAPSPLNEMYWSWNSGYRHFVFNFAVTNAAGAVGDGYVHVGSRDCAPEGGKALEDRTNCSFVNTPSVALTSFDLGQDTVAIDLGKLLAGLDFKSPILDPVTFEVIGEGTGIACHSMPSQSHCSTLFAHLGVQLATGAATANANEVFTKKE